MNSLYSLNQRYYNFEDYLKTILNEQKPLPSSSRSLFRKNRNNFEILCNEIFCRSVLLSARSAKTFFSATICILSPASAILKETLPPPALAWKRFCKEVRHLGAESFEIIGVVFCSILLLPLNRKTSSLLLNAQVWIEKKAEWISGEETLVYPIQETLNSAKAKKALLLQARNVIEVDKKEIEQWVDKAVDFDKIIERMDVLKDRRICRNYTFIPPREELDQKLTEIADIISDRIATVAIPKQKKTLTRLMQLYSAQPKDELIGSSCNASDPLEIKLTQFQQLQREIHEALDQLHKMHDPEDALGKEIKSLGQEIEQKLSDCFRDLFSYIRSGANGGLEGFLKEIDNYFSFVKKKFYEIDCDYSYKNVTQLDEAFPQNFVSGLKKQIADCQKLLGDQYLAWNTRGTISLDRQRALKILGLSENPSGIEIGKAYKRLSLIHHPDKGGQAPVFDFIHRAYEFLTK